MDEQEGKNKEGENGGILNTYKERMRKGSKREREEFHHSWNLKIACIILSVCAQDKWNTYRYKERMKKEEREREKNSIAGI